MLLTSFQSQLITFQQSPLLQSFSQPFYSVTFVQFSGLVPQLYVGAVFPPPKDAWEWAPLSHAGETHILSLSSHHVTAGAFVYYVRRNYEN